MQITGRVNSQISGQGNRWRSWASLAAQKQAKADFKDMKKENKEIFSDTKVLVFGQGLGSYTEWKSNGRFYFTSELTYFEILRYFGVFFGLIIIYFMFYPVIYGYNNRKYTIQKHIIIAYFLYLIMSFTNPLFFSSLGMLIFSIVISNIFIEKKYLKIQ